METAGLKLVKRHSRWFSGESPVVVRMTGNMFFIKTSGPVQASVRLSQYEEYVITFDGATGVISNVKHYCSQAGWSEPEEISIPLDNGFLQMIHVIKDVVHEV
uniref:Uncharacterized protein n=1 Tax=Pseudomonas phage RVTF4 TaxID=3236931 RepID=A0AB39CCZ0_9VIRU